MLIREPAIIWKECKQMSIIKKVARLSGLIEGMEIDLTTKEGKVIKEITDILADMADELELLSDEQELIRDELYEIGDTFVDMSDYIGDYLLDEDDIEPDDLYEIICSKCGNHFITDFESIDMDDVVCPDCGEPFVLEEEILEQLTDSDPHSGDV